MSIHYTYMYVQTTIMLYFSLRTILAVCVANIHCSEWFSTKVMNVFYGILCGVVHSKGQKCASPPSPHVSSWLPAGHPALPSRSSFSTRPTPWQAVPRWELLMLNVQWRLYYITVMIIRHGKLCLCSVRSKCVDKPTTSYFQTHSHWKVTLIGFVSLDCSLHV